MRISGFSDNTQYSFNNECCDTGCGSCTPDFESPEIQEAQAREYEVIQHENTHAAAGGGYAGAISYEYGEDGFIVAGETQIDTSFDESKPEEMAAKFKTVKDAALAPGDPSGQDLAVAGEADSNMARATELVANKSSLSALDGQPIFH